MLIKLKIIYKKLTMHNDNIIKTINLNQKKNNQYITNQIKNQHTNDSADLWLN